MRVYTAPMISTNRKLATRVVFFAVSVAAFALLPGCASQPGTTVLSYNVPTHEVPPTIIASGPGIYSLYASDEPKPIYTVKLQKDDEVGFVERGDKSVVAVALGHDIALTSALAKSYYWKMQEPKKEQQ